MSVRLYDAQPHHCRAIVGHDHDGIALYCAAPVTVRLNGMPSSWCVEHHARFTMQPRAKAAPKRVFVIKKKPSRILAKVDG